MKKAPLVIIPTAHFGLKRGVGKPVALVEFANKQKLFEIQIQNIRTAWPTAKIVYITGYQCEKYDPFLKSLGCKVINNLDFESTTIAYSLNLILDLFATNEFCLIYGNLYFTSDVLTKHLIPNTIEPKDQAILITSKKFPKKGIGLGPNKIFDFIFEDKWAKIAYFKGNVCNSLKYQLFLNSNQHLFEVISKMKTEIHTVDVQEDFVIQIKTPKDINLINNSLLS